MEEKTTRTTYKAKNGFTLLNADTGKGWEIRTPQDIITALLIYPYFQTVGTGVIWDTIRQAVEVRKEYEDIKDLANYLAENYI